MIITKNNIDKISELNLHDSELNEIICKYDEYKIIIPIKHYYLKKDMLLVFEDVLYSQISYYKLWGNGNYIFQCEINEDDVLIEQLKDMQVKELRQPLVTWSKLIECENLEDFFSLTLLLNSGDKINIISRKLSFNEINSAEIKE